MSGCPARTNPFRVARVSRLRYRLSEGEWRALLQRLRERRYRGALVGPHGSGKSTLLAELEQRLEAGGWSVRRLRLGSERRGPTRRQWRELLRGAGHHDVLSIDGAEQLGWLGWWGVLRRARGLGGLVITTHAPGRLPTLHRHRTDPALLQELVAELVTGEGARPPREELEREFRLRRGNLRDCLRALYDRSSAPPA